MIDRSKFARECVRSALYFGVIAHYLVAVAQVRSGITRGGDGERYGPFRLTTAEWNAHLTDGTFEPDFRPNDIMSWELQCSAFAAMTARSQDALSKRLGRMPSAVELYLTQWPASEPQTLAADLQVAFDDTADLMSSAFEEFEELMDSAEPSAGTVVEDVSQKIGETECLEFAVDEARVKELQHTFRGVGSPRASDEEQTIDLLIFTTRKWDEEKVSFNDERSVQLGFATARVRIPQDPHHKIGQVKHFSMEGVTRLEQGEFLNVINGAGPVQTLVFVHGYRNTLEESVLRLAQIVWDTQFSGVAIVFSWPSRGLLLSYLYDRESANFSVNGFSDFLQFLLEKTEPSPVHVLAHSMGNQVILHALAQLSRHKALTSLGEVIFAAPDVDWDVFGASAGSIKQIARGVTLYSSAGDKALVLAGKIAQRRRAGDVTPAGPITVPHVESIDMTAVGDLFGFRHNTFAANRSLIDDIGRLINTGDRPPHRRSPQLRAIPHGADPPRYWRYAE